MVLEEEEAPEVWENWERGLRMGQRSLAGLEAGGIEAAGGLESPGQSQERAWSSLTGFKSTWETHLWGIAREF